MHTEVAGNGRGYYMLPHPRRIFKKCWPFSNNQTPILEKAKKYFFPHLQKVCFVTVTFFQEDFLLRTSQVYQGQRPSLVHDLTYNKKTKKVNQTIDLEMSDNQN
jgi:hypothetical protein